MKSKCSRLVCRISFCKNKQSFYKTLILRAGTMGTYILLGILLALKSKDYFPCSRRLSGGFQKDFGLKFDVSASLGW